jgi:hypothetical protein
VLGVPVLQIIILLEQAQYLGGNWSINLEITVILIAVRPNRRRIVVHYGNGI